MPAEVIWYGHENHHPSAHRLGATALRLNPNGEASQTDCRTARLYLAAADQIGGSRPVRYFSRFRPGLLAETSRMNLCRVRDCQSAVRVKSLSFCSKHYKRFRKSGDPLVLITKNKPNGMARGITTGGYVFISGKKLEHVVVAEKALGKSLPKGALVHHWNEVKTDNRPENLLVCPNDAYHLLIHARMRALKACGDPNWCKCRICKQYDDPSNLSSCVVSIKKRPSQIYRYHRDCNSERARNRNRKLRQLKLRSQM